MGDGWWVTSVRPSFYFFWSRTSFTCLHELTESKHKKVRSTTLPLVLPTSVHSIRRQCVTHIAMLQWRGRLHQNLRLRTSPLTLRTSSCCIREEGNIKTWGYVHRHWCYLHRHTIVAREVISKGEVTYIAIKHGDRGNIKKWGYVHRHWCYLYRHRRYVHRHPLMATEVSSKGDVTNIAIDVTSIAIHQWR